MYDLVSSIGWLLVVLGLLITFHEFGHYWVARRCGVRVLRFSVGFGKPLWSWRGGNGTEFVIAAVPLGGYVKMLDERESAVPPEQTNEAFNCKSLGQRTAIIAAGPVFNLIFAVAAFWLMFLVGIPENRPVVGETHGIAAEAGLQSEDLIRRIDDRRVDTWTHAMLALIPAALDRRPVDLTIEDIGGHTRQIALPLDRIEGFREENALEHIGISPWRPELPSKIGAVESGSPAEQAGLRPGDRITAIGGEPVGSWQDITREIPRQAVAGQALAIELERGGQSLALEIRPETQSGRPIIGIGPSEPDAAQREAAERAFTVIRHGPLEGIGAAAGETWRLTTGSLGILGRMITGQASLGNLSGPITIAQLAGTSASQGISRFLYLLGLISLSLAIINLMPIPMLDGGHLLYYLIEAIKGSPVSEQTQVAGQYVGLLLIMCLMGLAIFNDILRLFP